MKSPTKRIFYHFGAYTLYLGTIWAPFWLHFDITDTVERCSTAPVGKNFACVRILVLKRQLKRLSGKKFQEISQ